MSIGPFKDLLLAPTMHRLLLLPKPLNKLPLRRRARPGPRELRSLAKIRGGPTKTTITTQ